MQRTNATFAFGRPTIDAVSAQPLGLDSDTVEQMSLCSSRRSTRRTALSAALAMAVVLLLVVLKGCTITVIAPAVVHDPVDVYLVDYGRHPAIVLPRSESVLVEYSYGEWWWYAHNRMGVSGAMRALLIRSEGTLGRRSLDALQHSAWRENVPESQLHSITVERAEADSLLQCLDAQFNAAAETAVYNPRLDLDLVQHHQDYSASNNSNIVLARWLEELGCTVRGWPLLPSRWRVVRQ